GRFARIRDRLPDAQAVVDADGSLSYAQLDQRATALAARLRAEGVVAGEVVAVAMARSAPAVVALLAVLKAGAAYLPLDVAQPDERLAFTLDDAGVRVALLDASQRGLLPGRALRRMVVDGDSGAVDAGVVQGECQAGASAAIDGDALAYVMYTSG